MKNIYEIHTPPAARVVSVGALRSIEASIKLEGFTDQTLAELGGSRRSRARNYPLGELNGPWAKVRRGHTEDTGKRPAVFYTYIKV